MSRLETAQDNEKPDDFIGRLLHYQQTFYITCRDLKLNNLHVQTGWISLHDLLLSIPHHVSSKPFRMFLFKSTEVFLI